MNLWSKLFVFSLIALSSTAHAISIDGDLNDWIGSPEGTISDWKPTDSGVSYFVDDQGSSKKKDDDHSYDAEAIYLTRDDLNFYIAIISDKLDSGTLEFDFSKGGDYDFDVDYDDGKAKIGGKVKKGAIDIKYQAAEYNDKSIKKLGQYDGKHYLLEARISQSLFKESDLGKSLKVSWERCEDAISTRLNAPTTTVETSANLPTPEILPMLAMGLLMLAAYNRNRDATAQSVSF